ncbi:hypothetical protein DPMN_048171 [Dreissena polymorpha]|uniref:Uncharacterized protein n=1 Tax=Dreissena polymorpha TaxID=45954 RepID=A0A9D4I3R2_DREPO|nr:hypothetical protein DPMN_048171 [Dreissena polymorpha]
MTNKYIIRTNLLTMFHEDPKINKASTGLTRQIFMTHNRRQKIDIRKNSPPPGDIIRLNLLTKIRTIHVASRMLTRKNAPPPDIIGTNLVTKFHDYRTINVASRVLTRFY